MAAARSELCCEWREADGALAALLGLLELVFGLNLCVEAHNLDREDQRPLARCLPEIFIRCPRSSRERESRRPSGRGQLFLGSNRVHEGCDRHLSRQCGRARSGR